MAVEEEVSAEVAAVAVDEAAVVVADSEEEADSVAAVVVEAVEVDEVRSFSASRTRYVARRLLGLRSLTAIM